MPKRVPQFRPTLAGNQPSNRHQAYNRLGRDPTLLKLYGTSRWKRFREHIRAERALCERCRAEGRAVPGVDVHHKIDPRDNPDLAFDESNVELLCRSHHSSETARANSKVRR